MIAALIDAEPVTDRQHLEKILTKSIATFIHTPVDESTSGTILFVVACLLFVQVLTVLKQFWVG